MIARLPHKPKLLVIVGPTASGKSELAVRLAKKLNGEIISADSRQIYKGLDVGTAKVDGRWLVVSGKKKFIYRDIPHHCIDFVSPRKAYTVADYQRCAASAITDITRRGKLPILAGGTGFWIDAVVYDIKIPPVPPNPRLRKKLEKKSIKELFRLLTKLDPRRAKTIEQKNPRRLIRAIEIAQTLGATPPLTKHGRCETFWIGIRPPPQELKKRITERTDAMIQGGLLAETRKLLSRRIPKKRIREFGFEYRLALAALEEKITRADLRLELVRQTMRYAKRQITWFKRNRAIHWIESPQQIKAKLPLKKLSFDLNP